MIIIASSLSDHFRTPRRGHHKLNEDRSDEYYNTRRFARRFLHVGRSATIIIAASLLSSSFAQRAVIALVANSLHHQQQVREADALRAHRKVHAKMERVRGPTSEDEEAHPELFR